MRIIKKGFTLIELGISMGIMGSLALVGAQEDQYEATQVKARALGNEVFQYNAAVSRYLAANAGDSSVVGVRTGSDWLKGSDCSAGTASEDFLACDLLPDNRTLQFGSQPRTTVSYSADGDLSARTVWDTVIGEHGKPDSMVMGTAAMVASGNYISQYDDVASGYQSPTVFCPDVATVSATISAICSADRNVIISTANITSTVEPWLRTDHTNTMRHAIEFDPDGNRTTDGDLQSVENRGSQGWLRQILGVARLYNESGSGGQSLVLGARTGNSIYSDTFLASNGLLNGSVVLDGNTAVMNDIYGKANAFIEGNVEAGNNVIAGGDVRAGGDVVAVNDVVAGNDLESGVDANIGRHANIGKNLQVGDNASIGKTLSVGGNINGAQNIYANGTLFSKGWIDDTYPSNPYTVNPTSWSKFTHMNLEGRVRVNEFLQLNRTVTEGGGCSPNGLVGKKSNGEIVSCVNGRWSGPGKMGYLAGTTGLSWNSSKYLPVPSGYSRSDCKFFATVGADTSDSNDYSRNNIYFDQNTGRVSSSKSGDYVTTSVNYMVLCGGGL